MPRAGHYPHKPATIKDIARELNISISTVSRVLRDMPDVNPETRQSVLQMVEKLDYQPNQIALSLVTKHTHTLGVIVPNLDYFFFHGRTRHGRHGAGSRLHGDDLSVE